MNQRVVMDERPHAANGAQRMSFIRSVGARSTADDVYPRVLIVNGEPLHRQSATGITLCNLFSGWPNEALAQVYTAQYAPATEFGTNLLRLSATDLVPFCWCTRRSSTPASAKSNLTESRRVGTARRYVSPLLELLPYRVAGSEIERLCDFKPDLIYSNLASIRIARLAKSLGNAFRVPLVAHFMDDWLSTYSVPGRSIGTRAHAAILHRQVSSIMHAAPLGLAIGQDMANEYASRFGRPFHPFMNTVDVSDTPDSPSGFSDRVRFVYVGGLHLGRDESLAAVARSIGNAAGSRLHELHIYAPDADRDRANAIAAIGRHVAYKGTVSPTDVPKVLRDADALVHVESFQPEVAQFTRLSVSTKIPQYLAAARPIVAFGPESLASIRYVARSGGGLSASNETQLDHVLRTIITDPEARLSLGASGWQQARTNHDAPTVRARFRETLRLAAVKGGIDVIR